MMIGQPIMEKAKRQKTPNSLSSATEVLMMLTTVRFFIASLTIHSSVTNMTFGDWSRRR